MDDLHVPTPESYTNEWYRLQFNRLNHLTALLHGAFTEAKHQENCLRKEVNELSKHRAQDAAKIGELMDLIDAMRSRSEGQATSIEQLTGRMDRASECIRNLTRPPQSQQAKDETK